VENALLAGVALAEVVRGWKAPTARVANLLLKRSGVF